MIVITLSDCPPALRGDLTKWLQEINMGVYIGHVSSRVRDQLWLRITENIKSGRATMVFNTRNEQKLDFRVHNTLWEPINFDGIKLMIRPSPSRIKKLNEKRSGYSNASKMRKARQMSVSKKSQATKNPSVYIVLDIETTGLSAKEHEIIEIGAIKVTDGKITDQYQTLVRIEKNIPKEIVKLTGIDDQMIIEQGKDLETAISELMTFTGEFPVVSHNGSFDYSFLRTACQRLNFSLFSNKCIDTIKMSRRLISGVQNYKLQTLLNYFGIEIKNMHRSLDDCMTTYQLYEKLIKFESNEK